MARGKAGGDLPRAKEATPTDPIKVLICDASSEVRRGIAQMVGTDDAILVVAEVGAADSVLPVVQDSDVDIVIGDPHQLSAEVITRALDAGTRVLVVSFTVDERHLLHAIDSGCSGYVDQHELSPTDWPRLVRLAAKGNRVFSDAAFELFRRSRWRSAAVKNGHDLSLPSARALSKRERQVLEHLVGGRTNNQIAQRLGVTDHTVKTQVTRIYEKLEVRTVSTYSRWRLSEDGCRNPDHGNARNVMQTTSNGSCADHDFLTRGVCPRWSASVAGCAFFGGIAIDIDGER